MFSRSRRKSAGLHDNLKPSKPTATTVQWDSPTGSGRETESSPAAGTFLGTRKTDLSNEPENRGDTLSQWNRGRMAKLADAQDLKSCIRKGVRVRAPLRLMSYVDDLPPKYCARGDESPNMVSGARRSPI